MNKRPAHVRDRIVADIELAIWSRKLQPGTAVESEHALAARHGVARATVRSALTALADRGLIKAVPGKGWYACGTTSARGPEVGDKVATDVYGRVTEVRASGDVVIVLDAPEPLVRDPGQVVILSRFGE